MPSDEMFETLAAEDLAAASTEVPAQRQTLTPIIPVPIEAPPCRWRHPKHGEPVAIWPYLDAAGQLIGHAARVEYYVGGERKKDFYPLTCGFRGKSPANPR